MPEKWVREFKERAGPKLRAMFAENLIETPPEIIERLEQLRQIEKKLLKDKPK